MTSYKSGISLFLTIVTVVLLSVTGPVTAATYPLPAAGGSVVGENYFIRAQPGDTLSSIAIRYGVGYYELLESNPQLQEDFLYVDERVTVPGRFILPAAPRQGIVVNLDELRLYYYPPGKNEVITFPVGIGRDEGWNTPVGKMTIIEKTENPTWYVPESIRKWRAEQGVELPKVVPPGPDNPLGLYRIRLSRPTYLLHGTNDPTGVGRRSSSGCIRLYPDDIKVLYNQIDLKNTVNIISEPYKAGWQGDRLYIESHLPLQEHQAEYTDQLAALKRVIAKVTTDKTVYIDWEVAEKVVKEEIGVPMLIGGTQPAFQQEAAVDFENRSRTLKGYQNLPQPFGTLNSETALFNSTLADQPA